MPLTSDAALSCWAFDHFKTPGSLCKGARHDAVAEAASDDLFHAMNLQPTSVKQSISRQVLQAVELERLQVADTLSSFIPVHESHCAAHFQGSRFAHSVRDSSPCSVDLHAAPQRQELPHPALHRCH